ncbi:MAG: hypothetical protein PUF11_09595 [Parafannyhessea umbonata]|uniref:hypothetical protein n=1 Tax=Parafannyhessea umbonata TaxID=604330 RepID=UPI0026EA418C|nr:hypothetical protein [Parafannyhessea umbonata]MDD6567019.1 hypothetical protein [Parafannyhessea umbonata]
MTGWVVFFACVSGAAVSVAAWFDGYAEGMADAVEPMAEWYRRHMGDSGAICAADSAQAGKHSTGCHTRP